MEEMKQARLVLGVFVLGIALIVASSGPGNYLTCQVIYREDMKVRTDSKALKAEVADSLAEQGKGLGGRDCIDEDQAMLFILDRTGQHAFWMKDMKFPIDIIWLSEDKRVVQIQANISPDSYPQTFKNDKPAKYVLELKAGQASRLGLAEGSTLRFQE